MLEKKKKNNDEKKRLSRLLGRLEYSTITRIVHHIKIYHSASMTTPNPNAASDVRSAALRSDPAAPLGPPLPPPATGLGARVTVTVDVGETAPTSVGPLIPPSPPPLKVVTAVVPPKKVFVFFGVVLADWPVVWADAAPEVVAGDADPVGPPSNTPV